MKLAKNLSLFLLLSSVLVLFSLLIANTNSVRVGKAEKTTDKTEESSALAAENALESEKKKKSSKRVKKHLDHRVRNDTWADATYRQLNESFVGKDRETIKTFHRKWDWSVIDKRIEDIYYDMKMDHETTVTQRDLRAFMTIFINHWDLCDTNDDNSLSEQEFKTCMSKDTYLSTVNPPKFHQAHYINYTYTNSTGFYAIIFNILDTHHTGQLSFFDYMIIRLMTFSWKKCSVIAPFIEEVNFECALKIASGYQSLSRTTVRRLYSMGLELTNNENLRNLDFISFLLIATSTRLYSEINEKEDTDITRKEFNLALDKNIIPMRYNQDIINQFFALVEDADKPNQGLDIHSFVFYDFFLRIFDQPNKMFGFLKARNYFVNEKEFLGTLTHYLFPNTCMGSIQKIPQNDLSTDSYQMLTYLNISNYHSEQDNLYKAFLETDEKITYLNKNRFEGATKKLANFRFKSTERKDNVLNLVGKNKNITFDLLDTKEQLFSIMDHDRDKFLNFYDFGTFVQITYLFTKFDKYAKGRVVAGDLYDKFTQYAEFPAVTHVMRDRAKKFSLMPADVYFDLSMTIVMLRIEDFINTATRRVDKSTLYEFELKNIFTFINLRFVPDIYLNKCLRGVDTENVPLYDWECAFTKSMVQTLTYFESSYAYLTTQARNLSLANTVFINPDPILRPPVAKK